MKLSTLIKKLEKLQEKHGNVNVMVDVDSFDCTIDDVEFNEHDSRVIIYLGDAEGIDY